MLIEYLRTKDRRLLERVVQEYQPLVASIAKGFLTRGEPMEDLMQVGNIGLIKAIERFEPERCLSFGTYSAPTISGEIQRYFRDKVSAVKVSRPIYGLIPKVFGAEKVLTLSLGREPSDREIAQYLGLSEEKIAQVRLMPQAMNMMSLDSYTSDTGDALTFLDTMGEEDPGIIGLVENADLHHYVSLLPERYRDVITYYFFKERSQNEIGELLEISQREVHRRIKKALSFLQNMIIEKGEMIFTEADSISLDGKRLMSRKEGLRHPVPKKSQPQSQIPLQKEPAFQVESSINAESSDSRPLTEPDSQFTTQGAPMDPTHPKAQLKLTIPISRSRTVRVILPTSPPITPEEYDRLIEFLQENRYTLLGQEKPQNAPAPPPVQVIPFEDAKRMLLEEAPPDQFTILPSFSPEKQEPSKQADEHTVDTAHPSLEREETEVSPRDHSLHKTLGGPPELQDLREMIEGLKTHGKFGMGVKYSRELKRAVARAIVVGKVVKNQLVKEFGISPPTISSCLEEFQEEVLAEDRAAQLAKGEIPFESSSLLRNSTGLAIKNAEQRGMKGFILYNYPHPDYAEGSYALADFERELSSTEIPVGIFSKRGSVWYVRHPSGGQEKEVTPFMKGQTERK